MTKTLTKTCLSELAFKEDLIKTALPLFIKRPFLLFNLTSDSHHFSIEQCMFHFNTSPSLSLVAFLKLGINVCGMQSEMLKFPFNSSLGRHLSFCSPFEHLHNAAIMPENWSLPAFLSRCLGYEINLV